MAFNTTKMKTSYIYQPAKSPKEQALEALPPLSDAVELFEVWSWSADGKWLAGTAYSAAGIPTGVVNYSLESQEYRRLTDSGTHPIWLSDSRRLLFHDSGEIFLLDSDSGRADEVLSISPDTVGRPAVSHDNRWIYFTRRTSEADIWLLTLDEEQ